MVPKILIVDDVPANLVALKALLRGLDKEVEVISANSGSEALEKVLEHEFALILTDVQMPEMDGFEMAAILQEHDEWNQIPVIFITAAYKDEQNRDRGYSAGAVDYIQKPIEEHVLLSKTAIFLKLYEQRQIIKNINVDLEKRVAERTAELLQTQAMAKIGGWSINPQTWEENLSEQACAIICGVPIGDPDCNCNSSLSEMLSEEDREYHFGRIRELVDSVDGQYEFLAEFTTKNDQMCHVFCNVECMYENGKLVDIRGIIQDITERQRAEEIIQYLEMHDALTTLPNRNSFHEQALSYVADTRAMGEQLAVMLIDLDKFKDVNDVHGQAVADLMLAEIARRLNEKMTQYETLYRVGGDEFAVVLRGIENAVEVAQHAESYLQAIAEEFVYFGDTISVSASMGISLFPQDADDVDSLMKSADLAMSRSKEDPGIAYNFYDKEMSQTFQRRKEQEIRLHHAIERNFFELYYQPKINLKTNEIQGVEALIRWNDPELGFVGPDEFIPLAEETGQIRDLGRWIIREACEAAARWKKELGRTVPVAINISVEQIKCPKLPDFFQKVMNEVNITPDMIEVEITETALLDDRGESRETLRRLKEMDLGIALDDFGTGYSSLTHLKSLLPSSIKIDRSFIQNIMTDPSDAHIADMIICVAHNLKMTVIAEGVEEIEQCDRLNELNCDIGQGYFYSKPLPEADFLSWYHDYAKAS
ncbi:EAL domain-containing protein [Curvivirga aplysinae]|uniref:EAL domain-containing protein n=1 Tax=Curvivirga aplysinae TaxID=2529852 RepID=UPI0012BBF998|nr:EAL domain-containing protein [Curvivirga aplysinae]MTI10622.1 GGDEF and EAL domain-containing protein [Curvivirga aplysinae]